MNNEQIPLQRTFKTTISTPNSINSGTTLKGKVGEGMKRNAFFCKYNFKFQSIVKFGYFVSTEREK